MSIQDKAHTHRLFASSEQRDFMPLLNQLTCKVEPDKACASCNM